MLLLKTLHDSYISCENQNDEECDIYEDPNINIDDDNDDNKDRAKQVKTNMTNTLYIFKHSLNLI